MAVEHTVRNSAGTQYIRYAGGVVYILTKNVNNSGSSQSINPKIKIVP